MGKGGLSFLNKKSWHTATIANAEKVWLAEQKDAAEKAKLAQLQKEIAEERQVEELRALQRQHGVGQKAVERLDWMYRSAEIEAEIKQKEKEEFLLGKPIPASALAPEPSKPAGVEAISANGTERWVKKYEQRDLDAETRIREDPMLLILKQEQEQRLSILKNPLQMKRIREEVDKAKLLKKLKKMEKEEKKKLKKMEKKKKAETEDKKRRSPSRSISPDARRDETDKYGLIQPRASVIADDRHHLHQDDDRGDRHHHRRRPRPSSDNGQHNLVKTESPSASKRERRYSLDRDDRRHSATRNRDRTAHGERRSRSPSQKDEHRRYSSSLKVERRHRPYFSKTETERCLSPSSQDACTRPLSPNTGRRDRSSSPRSNRHRSQSHYQPYSPRTEPRRSPSPKTDPRQSSDTTKAAHELKLEAIRSRISHRLERRRDVTSSTASKLTPEEREARLKAMMSDAQNQHEIRSKQLALDVEAQKLEEEALRRRNADASNDAEFIQKLKKQAFMESADTVEDRIKQRVHYRQKGSTEYHSFL